MGIDAFVLGAQSVERLAFLVFLALHAFTTIRDADTVIFLRRIAISAMPGLPRRAPHLYILGMGPFDVVVFSEAAIDQIVARSRSPVVPGRDPNRWCRCRPQRSPGV